MTAILLTMVLLPVAAALAVPFIAKKRDALTGGFALAVTAAQFAMSVALFVLALQGYGAQGDLPGVCTAFGLGFTLDGFRALYAMLASFMWLMTTLLSKRYFEHYTAHNRYAFFLLLTLGATVGVFFSRDLMTTFVFFEIMSFASYTWVEHDESDGALRAADTYLAVAVVGGMTALMGLFLLYYGCGTLAIDDLPAACQAAAHPEVIFPAGICVLVGFGAKAGVFPLHIWLPKAHPVAPAPASALLSGMLTKTGIYGLIILCARVFPGDERWGAIILALGVVTMLVGAVLALFSVDLKRTLACSSVSQIGFISVGLGMCCLLGVENRLAAAGALLHMVNHSLIKLVLFNSAGVVHMNAHRLNLNEIRGFGRNKPILKISFLLGALSIAGVPLFSGYVSKTLLHESIVEKIELIAEAGGGFGLLNVCEILFLIAGGMTAAYMTKLFVAVFVEKHPTEQARFDAMRPQYLDFGSAASVLLPALLMPLLGAFPDAFMKPLARLAAPFFRAEPLETVHYFAWGNLKGAAISLSIGALLYFALIRARLMAKDETGARVYLDRWPKWLDLEEGVYRPLVEKWLPMILGGVASALDKWVFGGIKTGLLAAGAFAARVADALPDIAQRALIGAGGFFARMLDLGPFFGDLPGFEALFKKLFAAAALIGRLLDHLTEFIVLGLRRTLYRDLDARQKPPRAPSRLWRRLETESDVVSRTFSFGLLMTCVGLCTTIIYLLTQIF